VTDTTTYELVIDGNVVSMTRDDLKCLVEAAIDLLGEIPERRETVHLHRIGTIKRFYSFPEHGNVSGHIVADGSDARHSSLFVMPKHLAPRWVCAGARVTFTAVFQHPREIGEGGRWLAKDLAPA
jgi:hypothetical protein